MYDECHEDVHIVGVFEAGILHACAPCTALQRYVRWACSEIGCLAEPKLVCLFVWSQFLIAL